VTYRCDSGGLPTGCLNGMVVMNGEDMVGDSLDLFEATIHLDKHTERKP